MTDVTRVLITGSRDWTDEGLIWNVLSPYLPAVLVHGACPTGADEIASTLWVANGGTEEPHPADWSLGKKAGPLRNQEMVDLGADICLAFPLLESRGTRDCMRRATAAGIPVRNCGTEPAKPDLAAVAKAIQDAAETHRVSFMNSRRFVCVCGEGVSRNLPGNFDAHRYDAMARAAADALGVTL